MSATSPDYRGNHPRGTPALLDWHASAPAAPALEPDIPIVDPHHHLFGKRGDPLYYELEDLRRDLSCGHRIIGTVYVEAYEAGWRETGPEALRPVGEVERIEALTRDPLVLTTGPCAVAGGIVGCADLALGDRVDEVLEAEEAAGRGRLRGVRYRTASIGGAVGRATPTQPGPHLLIDPQVQSGVRRLGARGLSFDAWAYHTQLDELMRLADAAPRTTIIVDHVAGPIGVEEFRAHRSEMLVKWQSDLRSLATRPNVLMKIGGMGMPLYGFDLHRLETPPSYPVVADCWRPLVEPCIEIFGPDRCMFESNFPVDKQSASYADLWNAHKHIVRGFSRDEKAALFHGTACRAYRLPVLEAAAAALWQA